MAHFDDLPTEILAWIISLLYQIYGSNTLAMQALITHNLVNKRFYDAISSVVWRSVVIGRQDRPRVFLSFLMASPPSSIGQHVRHLTFANPSCGRILLLMLTYIDQLACLVLPEANSIDDNSIQLMHRHLRNLTCLKLENAAITDRSIKLIMEQCRQLTTLELHHCPRLTCAGLSVLSGAPSSLQHLDINVLPMTRRNWMTIDTSSSSSSRNNNNNTDEIKLVMDTMRLTRLTEFKLIGAPTRFVQQLLSTLTSPNDDDGRAWPCLVGLSLSDTDGTIGDDRLVPFIQARPELTTLSLAGTNMTDATLTAIAQFLPDIHTIEIMDSQRISSRGVRRLARQCSRIARIHMGGCGLLHRDFPEMHNIISRRDVTLDQRSIDDIQQCYSSEPEKNELAREWMHVTYPSDSSDNDSDSGPDSRTVFYDIDDFDHYHQGNLEPWRGDADFFNFDHQ